MSQVSAEIFSSLDNKNDLPECEVVGKKRTLFATQQLDADSVLSLDVLPVVESKVKRVRSSGYNGILDQAEVDRRVGVFRDNLNKKLARAAKLKCPDDMFKDYKLNVNKFNCVAIENATLYSRSIEDGIFVDKDLDDISLFLINRKST